MKVGSLVVCVKAPDFIEPYDFSAPLIEGNIYTVRALIEHSAGPPPKYELGIALDEIFGKMLFVKTWRGYQWVEYHWHPWRFVEVLPPEELAIALENLDEVEIEAPCLP